MHMLCSPSTRWQYFSYHTVTYHIETRVEKCQNTIQGLCYHVLLIMMSLLFLLLHMENKWAIIGFSDRGKCHGCDWYQNFSNFFANFWWYSNPWQLPQTYRNTDLAVIWPIRDQHSGKKATLKTSQGVLTPMALEEPLLFLSVLFNLIVMTILISKYYYCQICRRIVVLMCQWQFWMAVTNDKSVLKKGSYSRVPLTLHPVIVKLYNCC